MSNVAVLFYAGGLILVRTQHASSVDGAGQDLG